MNYVGGWKNDQEFLQKKIKKIKKMVSKVFFYILQLPHTVISNSEKFTHPNVQYRVLLQRPTCPTPTPQLTAQFRSKIWASIFDNICWFVQGRNMNMIICIQNTKKNILNINRLWSSITEDMKLLFEFIYIYEVFTVKRKYKSVF